MGPLQGLRVVEFAGIGPGPMAGMLLADMGADVVLIERPRAPTTTPTLLDPGPYTLTHRGKRSVALDLKHADGLAAAAGLVARAEVLIEGFRPGVMERLGLGPEVCLARNPRLVYARMTGWGQTGPLAQRAGHDLNYAALCGALDLGRYAGEGRPWMPPTLLGDMGGGAMPLAFGIVCGVLEARRSGRGQVVDAAICDGTAVLASLLRGVRAADPRAACVLDGSAPFYNVYQCADAAWISVGALEPQFYAELLACLELRDVDPAAQMDQTQWPALRARFAAVFATRTQAQWCAVFDGSDACFAPVLTLEAADGHAHAQARAATVAVDGVRQAAPTPRFSVTPGEVRSGPPVPGAHTEEVLRAWGV